MATQVNPTKCLKEYQLLTNWGKNRSGENMPHPLLWGKYYPDTKTKDIANYDHYMSSEHRHKDSPWKPSNWILQPVKIMTKWNLPPDYKMGLISEKLANVLHHIKIIKHQKHRKDIWWSPTSLHDKKAPSKVGIPGNALKLKQDICGKTLVALNLMLKDGVFFPQYQEQDKEVHFCSTLYGKFWQGKKGVQL